MDEVRDKGGAELLKKKLMCEIIRTTGLFVSTSKRLVLYFCFASVFNLPPYPAPPPKFSRKECLVTRLKHYSCSAKIGGNYVAHTALYWDEKLFFQRCRTDKKKTLTLEIKNLAHSPVLTVLIYLFLFFDKRKFITNFPAFYILSHIVFQKIKYIHTSMV